jgi:hypothetical protein
MKSKLFNRKSDSRESSEPSWFSLRRSGQRCSNSDKEATVVTPMKAKNIGPMADWAKACTDDSTPERVRKVPKMTSA